MTLSRRGLLTALFSPLVARRSRPVAFSNEITGGQGALVRPAIKSPKYSPGVSGWTINRDGSAEFNNLTIRGTFNGTDFVINAAGAFFYSGTPAAGNLIASIAPNPGVDAHGNHFPQGIMSASGSTAGQLFANLSQGNLFMGAYTGSPASPDLSHASALFPTASTGQVALETGTTASTPQVGAMLMTPSTGTAGAGASVQWEDVSGAADFVHQVDGHYIAQMVEAAATMYGGTQAAAATGKLIDLQNNIGASQFTVDASGNLTKVGTVAGITTGHAQDTANSTTTSTIYAASSVALSTSIVLGPSGKFVASLLVRCDNTGTNNTLSGMLITGSVSGTIMNPTDATSIQWNQTTSAGPFETRQFHSGTPGETITVTAQHRVTTGTGTFRYRDILVQSLPV